MYECYKPNYFENWYITLSLAIKYAEQKKKKVALSEEEWWSIHQWWMNCSTLFPTILIWNAFGIEIPGAHHRIHIATNIIFIV